MRKPIRPSYVLHARITRWAPAIGVLTLGTVVGGGAAASALVAGPAGNGPTATDTAVTLFPGSVVVGQQFRVTATVTPKFGMPTGWVDFDLDGTALSDCHHIKVAGPIANCLTSLAKTGEHTVNARFSADDTTALAGSTGTVEVTASRAKTQLVVLPATSPQAGRPFTPTVLVLPVAPGYGHPSGAVTLTDDVAGDSCTITLPSTSCELPGLPKGRHDLHAAYHGDDDFDAAQSPAIAQSVLSGGPNASSPAAAPTNAQPVAAEPVQKPVETKPVETKPVETKPVEATPVEATPVEAKPIETEPVDSGPPAAVTPPPAQSSPATRPVPYSPPRCGALTSHPYCGNGMPYPNRP